MRDACVAVAQDTRRGDATPAAAICRRRRIRPPCACMGVRHHTKRVLLPVRCKTSPKERGTTPPHRWIERNSTRLTGAQHRGDRQSPNHTHTQPNPWPHLHQRPIQTQPMLRSPELPPPGAHRRERPRCRQAAPNTTTVSSCGSWALAEVETMNESAAFQPRYVCDLSICELSICNSS